MDLGSLEAAMRTTGTTLLVPDDQPLPEPLRRHGPLRTLLLCGALAGPLFVITFLIEGALRPQYQPLRHPVSSLALGDSGWTQSANFIVTGLLVVGFAVGVRLALKGQPGSVAGALLVGVWGAALVAAGAFLTDPVSGYPPGTPAMVEHATAHGTVHDLASLAGFAALAASCFVFARRFAKRRQWGWLGYSVLSGLAFIVTLVLTTAGFAQAAGLVDVAGLLQRITVSIGWCWLSLLAFHVLKASDH
jgi:hypothetical protein